MKTKGLATIATVVGIITGLIGIYTFVIDPDTNPEASTTTNSITETDNSKYWQTIHQAKGKMENIGQSEALSALSTNQKNLDGINLEHTWYSGVSLQENTHMRQSKLEGVNFLNARMRNVDASLSNFNRSNLNAITALGANFENSTFVRANLSYAHLVGSYFSQANFTHSDLSHTNLSVSQLSKSNLSDANLSQANLHSADLNEANLSGANLSQTKLDFANLTNTDLSRIKKGTLSDSQLKNACVDPTSTKLPASLTPLSSDLFVPDKCCNLWRGKYGTGVRKTFGRTSFSNTSPAYFRTLIISHPVDGSVSLPRATKLGFPPDQSSVCIPASQFNRLRSLLDYSYTEIKIEDDW